MTARIGKAFVQAKHYRRSSRAGARLIVLHCMEYPERKTAAEWCAGFFTDPRRPKRDPKTKAPLYDANGRPLTEPVTASAHFCVDSDSVVQCVERKDVAYHVPGYLSGFELNAISYGIEHHGYSRQTRDDWFDEESLAALEISAELVARLCFEDGIPPVFLSAADLSAGKLDGITGHVHCTKASGKGTHWDPGNGFPWDWYIARVQAHYELLAGYNDVLRDIANAPEKKAPEGWPIVEYDGKRWAVAPIYIWPIGIGQAREIAHSLGCVVPSPGLVNAIWEAADVKIDIEKMIFTAENGNDFTPKTMASIKTFNRQAMILEREIAGRTFTLLDGYAKNVVEENGVIGIYGGHRLDGRVIQKFYPKHALGWIDYLQGLRCVMLAP